MHKKYSVVTLILKDTTTVPFGTGVICAPLDVNPGHIIFAPLRTKRIAPLSTCCFGRKKGSEKKHQRNDYTEKNFFRISYKVLLQFS